MDISKNECAFEENMHILRSIPIFSGLSMEPIKALAYVCKRVQYAQGDILFERGAQDDQAYYLVQGVLEITLEEEGQSRTLRRLEPGAVIGSLSLVAATRRLFTLRAAAPATCMILPQRHFLTLLGNSPECAQTFFKAVYQAIYQWEEELLSRPEWREVSRGGDYFGVTLI
ncbi:Crp/Fnr family transcriptional regulator [Desulfonatronum thioautotrophicum]|uniref:Crp/Fnr family transcriptional regulator n=1 Tax=Desulfonatronum thioautotrophicum TaxID=617001 RepID=UPI0013792F8A|nr:cyclic nucleotide-binding domain-containing protein [Desulfonatronum thioautotrophicum]